MGIQSSKHENDIKFRVATFSLIADMFIGSKEKYRYCVCVSIRVMVNLLNKKPKKV